MRVNVPFTLDPDDDADLVRWLDSLPRKRRSPAIREARCSASTR